MELVNRAPRACVAACRSKGAACWLKRGKRQGGHLSAATVTALVGGSAGPFAACVTALD